MKSQGFFFSAYILIFFISGVFFAPLMASEYLKLGDIAFREGKFEDARDAYRQAIVENPKNVPARLALGHALFALGEYKYAFIELRQGLEMHAAPHRIYPNLRDYYSSEEVFFEKLKNLQAFLRKHPSNFPAQFVYAYVCYYSGFKREARKTFTSLLRQPHLQSINRKWVVFYLNLLSEEKILEKSPLFLSAIHAMKQANYLEAHKNLLRLIYEQPSLGIPPLFLCHIFFALGYYKLAYRYLERGVFFRPHNRILNALWGKYYKNRGEWLRLLIALEGHVSMYPKDFEAKLLLLFMYYSFQKYVSAQTLLSQLQNMGKTSYTLPVLAYLLKKKQKKLLKEKESLTKSQGKPSSQPLSKAEEYFQKLWKLGKNYLLEEDFEAAMLAFQSLMKKDVRAYYLVGYTYFAQEKFTYSGDMIREGIIRTQGKKIPFIIDYFEDVDTFFRRKRHLESYLSKHREDHLAALLLALIEFQLQKKDRAKKILLNLVAKGEERASLILLRRLQKEKNQKKEKPISGQLIPKKKKQIASQEKIQVVLKIQGKLPNDLAQKKGKPRFVMEVNGKKYPVYQVGNKKYVFYQGRFYLYLGKDNLKPFTGNENYIELPFPISAKPANPKKTKKEPILLDQFLSPAKPKWILRPNQPLWIPSKD